MTFCFGRRAAARLAAAALLALAATPFVSPQGQPVVSLAVENLDEGARLILNSTRPLPFHHPQQECPARRAPDLDLGPFPTLARHEPFVPLGRLVPRNERLHPEGRSRRALRLEPLSSSSAVPARHRPETHGSRDAGPPRRRRRRPQNFSRKSPRPNRARSLPIVPSGAKRIRTVVIDPGHGGIESGAKGVFGAQEKDVTLAISLKLKDVLEKSMAFRVVMTRDRDTEIELPSRAAVANNNKADVFISLHTNGSRRKLAQGSETSS
jgi:N-acetylmuramoyl-L-alanine amidase